MARRLVLFSGAALLAAGFAAPATAQSCGSEIDRLAQQFNISPETPHAGTSEAPKPPADTSGRTTTERLAQSGGVITPPDTGAPMAIQPPLSNPDRMPTTPDVRPNPSPATPRDSSGLSAADRARIGAALQAARNAEREGKEAQCLERLREAQAIAGALAK